MKRSRLLPSFAPIGPTILRTVIGLVFFMHGYQKVFENGIAATQDSFSGLGIPFPGVLGATIPFLELVGGLSLIAGFLTRFLGLMFTGVSVVATATVHWDNGFFSQSGGFEYTLVLAVASLALIGIGPGLFAFDGWLADRLPMRRRRANPFTASGTNRPVQRQPVVRQR